MEKYIKFINEFHEWNQIEIDFINNQLSKHLKDNNENQDEIEQILDYLYSKKSNISKIWYKTILEKSKKWHESLTKLSSKNDEIVWEDYEIVLDFKDWFKFVKLISQNSYNREWKLMSHCVASYFGRNVNIYSLRDENNNPHCTIEEWQQVKWKWNWSIDPKYVDYVVRFLESLGMSVWENEMKNLWYYKLEKIDTDLSSDSLYNWYISENKLDTIKDKEWNTYNWFWLLNLKDLVIFKTDIKFIISLDIEKTTKYLLNSVQSIFDNITWKNKDNKKFSNKTDSAKIGSSWNYAKIGSSWYSAQIGSSWDYAQIGSSWYSAQIGSSWDSAQIGSSWYSAQIGSSWDSSKIGSSWDSAQIGSSWDYAKIGSSWNSAQITSEWNNAVIAWIWYNNKISAKIWSWITLAEYNDKWICTCVKSQQIDWEILKEDTFYKLGNWEFKECI